MNQDFSVLNEHQKVYFASDFHLGTPSLVDSKIREKRIVRWLNEISLDAQAIFLVGDLFDFWFEYKHTVPKGYVRFLGKLAELSDQGIEIIIFAGNHDLWLNDYLVNEIGAKIYHQPHSFNIGGKHFYIGHGDGLGDPSVKEKLIKTIFSNHFCQWLFGWLHPNIGISLARSWSGHSRSAQDHQNLKFYGEKEWLIQYSRKIEEENHHSFYIYGHRHIISDVALSKTSRYINLGEWVFNSPYAVFDGVKLSMKAYTNE